MLIALTGGIGSGKSTVAAEWARLGAIEIDADQLAREVVEPGQPGLVALVSAFGNQLLDESGRLDRSRLAQLSFSDPAIRRRVEGILHPLIQEQALARTVAHKDKVIVYTIPLFVETKSPLSFDKVVTVNCPADVRVERLVKRGMSREDALGRIAAQATDEQRQSVADLVIDSNCNLEELLIRSREAYRNLTNG